MNSRPRVGTLWEQRVSTKGDSYFYDPDSHSLYRQKQIGKHGEQRVVYQRVVEDYSEPPYKQQDVGEPSQYLPSAVTDLRTRGLFQKWERRVDADGELRTYREFRDKYQTSRYGGQWEVGFRWEEARSRSISWRLRMSTFERRLLKPIGWAVATKFEGCDLSSRRRTVYYERAGSQLGGNLPQSLERLAREESGMVSRDLPSSFGCFRTWDPKRMAFHDGSLRCPPDVILDADAEAIVEGERLVRVRASTNSELHTNLEGLFKFDLPTRPTSASSSLLGTSHQPPSQEEAKVASCPNSALCSSLLVTSPQPPSPDDETEERTVRKLQDEYGEFSIYTGRQREKSRITVPVLNRSAHRLDPWGRWMPVFDVGPEPCNLPRENDGYWALLAPGETYYAGEDGNHYEGEVLRNPRFVPYNGLFVCSRCFEAGHDEYCPKSRRKRGVNDGSIYGAVSVDSLHLVRMEKEAVEHERDAARLALVAAEAEISKLRRQIATAPTRPALAGGGREASVVAAEPQPQQQPQHQPAPEDPAAKKRAQEARRAAEVRAKVDGGLILTRNGIEEHSNELLQAFLKAMGLPVRGSKSDMQSRLRKAFDGLGVSTWNFSDAKPGRC